MDTQFLNTFVVVADRGSMAAAARVLNITPAAVAGCSWAMAKLDTNVATNAAAKAIFITRGSPSPCGQG